MKGKIKQKAADLIAKFRPYCASHDKAKKAAIVCLYELRTQFEKEFVADYDVTGECYYAEADIKYTFKMMCFDYMRNCINAF